ncbi:MAG TPA: hypothetical protein V6C78_07780 [Crinalium sp.]
MSSSRHSFPSVAIAFPIHLAQPGESEITLAAALFTLASMTSTTL